jgi:hypothetical protein
MHNSATVGHPASRFIAALILPGTDQTGALAVLDHAGELILHAPLPKNITQDAHDPEGLLAHLTHFVPSLSAVTDLFVSWLPASIDNMAAPARETFGFTSPSSSAAWVLRLLAWLGPIPRVVAPATWLAHHGLHPGSSETLRQACARQLPGLMLSFTASRVTDDVRAAVLLAHCAPALIGIPAES